MEQDVHVQMAGRIEKETRAIRPCPFMYTPMQQAFTFNPEKLLV
jgi:hypothetical protein